MSDANKVMVQALRPFEGEEGFKNAESAPFEVSRQRFAELKANSLVAEAVTAEAAIESTAAEIAPVEERAAPKPANKRSAKPENK